MTAPSSSPCAESTPVARARWETQLRPVERVVDDEAPDPRPNHKTRRAAARNARRTK